MNIVQIEKLRKKRFRRELKKREKRRIRARVYRHVARGQESPVLKFLRSNMRAENRAFWEPSEDSWVIKIPEVFSFTHNPNETLNAIYSVVEISRLKDRRRLLFDHRDCREISLGASVVLDVVAMHLRREWIGSGKEYRLQGYFPRDANLSNLLRCTGLTKNLRIRGAEASPEVEERFVKTEMMVGSASTAATLIRSSDQEQKATDLAKFLDRCFQRAAGYRLTRRGYKQIVRWAGELITNAEEHSGENEWYAISYMTPEPSPVEGGNGHVAIGACHLVVFSFGRSIYQTLSSASTPEETRRQVAELAGELSKRNLIGRSLGFSAADLWTLYALQDGVSRHSERPGGTSRGSGTIQVIDAFQRLGDSADAIHNPEMVLISGGTRILFNKNYTLKSHGERMVLAFNAANDLRQRPDPKHVHSIGGIFPGTILSFKFFIDRRHLDRVARTD